MNYPRAEMDWVGSRECRCCSKAHLLPLATLSDERAYCRDCLIAAVSAIDGAVTPLSPEPKP